MIRGKYLRERKAKRIKFGTKIILCMIIFVVLYKLVFSSFSLYESEAKSEANIDIAFYLLGDSYNTKVISLKDMKPGDEQEVIFSIANYKVDDAGNTIQAETDIEYELKVRTTTNLPLDYELRVQDMKTPRKSLTLTPTQDADKTYFFNLISEKEIITHGTPFINTYKLIIRLPEDAFPPGEESSKYQGMMECIEIKLDSRQVIN